MEETLVIPTLLCFSKDSGLFEGLVEETILSILKIKTCNHDTTIVIESIPFLSHDIIAQDLTCFESGDGAIIVSASLGTAICYYN